jgi:CheY-like chemotaxis protein
MDGSLVFAPGNSIGGVVQGGAVFIFAATLAFLVAIPWMVLILVPLLIVAAMPFIGATVFLAALIARAESREAKRTRVLVVDDEIDSVLPLISVLENSATDVHYVTSGKDMIRELANRQYDLVFLDSKMPEMSGESSLAEGDQILTLGRRLPVIFYSGSSGHVVVPGGLKQFDIRGIWNKFDLASLESSVASVVGGRGPLPIHN